MGKVWIPGLNYWLGFALFLLCGVIAGLVWTGWLSGAIGGVGGSGGPGGNFDGRLVFPAASWGSDDLGTPQRVNIERFNAGFDAYFEQRNNFQRVGDLPDTAKAQRLARGVGRIEILTDGGIIPCTGALISTTHVLTAGHCFYDDRTRAPVKAKAVRLRLNLLGKRDVEAIGAAGEDASRTTLALNLDIGALASGVIDNSHPERTEIVFAPDAARGYDYAVIPLKAGEYACAAAAANPENEEAVAACRAAVGEKAAAERLKARRGFAPAPVELGMVKLEPMHELLVLHHPSGKELVLTQRYCQAQVLADAPAKADDPQFDHLCDTLGGSSGAPVFSLEHDVVVGVHVCCSQLNASQTQGLNTAMRIEKIAERNPVVRALIIKDPMTAGESRMVDYAAQRSLEAQSELERGNARLALFLALDGYNNLTVAAGRREALLERTGGLSPVLSRALYELSERVMDRIVPGTDSASLISANGARLLMAYRPGPAGKDTLDRVEVWDLKLRKKLDGWRDVPSNYEISGDGTKILQWANGHFRERQVGGTWSDTLNAGGALAGVKLSANGKLAAVWTRNGSLGVWDTEAKRQVAVTEHDMVDGVVFSPDNSTVQIWGSKGFSYWQFRGGAGVQSNQLLTFPEGADYDDLDGLRVSPTGDKWLYIDQRNTSDVFDVHLVGPDVDQKLAHPTLQLNGVEFSPNGNEVLSWDAYGFLWTWNTVSKAISRDLRDRDAEVRDVSGDGSRVLYWNDAGQAMVYDVSSWKRLAQWNVPGRLPDLYLTSDGAHVVSAAYQPADGRQRNVTLWDAMRGVPIARWTGDFRITVGRDKVFIQQDGLIKAWSTATGKQIDQAIALRPKDTGWTVSSDGAVLLTWTDTVVSIWRTSTGARIADWQLGVGPHDTVFSSEGRYLVVEDRRDAATDDDRSIIRVWSLAESKEVGQWPAKGLVLDLLVTPDGSRILVKDAGRLVVLDGATAEEIALRDFGGDDVLSPAMSDDGTQVMLHTGYVDNRSAIVWQADTGNSIARHEHVQSVRQNGFVPGVPWGYSWDYAGNMAIWDTRNGVAVAKRLPSPTGSNELREFRLSGATGTMILLKDAGIELWDAPLPPWKAIAAASEQAKQLALFPAECAKYGLSGEACRKGSIEDMPKPLWEAPE